MRTIWSPNCLCFGTNIGAGDKAIAMCLTGELNLCHKAIVLGAQCVLVFFPILKHTRCCFIVSNTRNVRNIWNCCWMKSHVWDPVSHPVMGSWSLHPGQQNDNLCITDVAPKLFTSSACLLIIPQRNSHTTLTFLSIYKTQRKYFAPLPPWRQLFCGKVCIFRTQNSVHWVLIGKIKAWLISFDLMLRTNISFSLSVQLNLQIKQNFKLTVSTFTINVWMIFCWICLLLLMTAKSETEEGIEKSHKFENCVQTLWKCFQFCMLLVYFFCLDIVNVTVAQVWIKL